MHVPPEKMVVIFTLETLLQIRALPAVDRSRIQEAADALAQELTQALVRGQRVSPEQATLSVTGYQLACEALPAERVVRVRKLFCEPSNSVPGGPEEAQRREG